MCVSTGAFLMVVFCRSGPCLPLLLHRHTFMSLQQLGPSAGGAEEGLRLHLQEASHSEVRDYKHLSSEGFSFFKASIGEPRCMKRGNAAESRSYQQQLCSWIVTIISDMITAKLGLGVMLRGWKTKSGSVENWNSSYKVGSGTQTVRKRWTCPPSLTGAFSPSSS